MRACIHTIPLVVALLHLVSGQDCPGSVGHINTNHKSRRIRNIFYINVGDPAQCNGVITSFSYCYHRPRDEDFIYDEYFANFAMYRRESGNIFTAISPTFVIRIKHDEIKMDFTCSNLTLNQSVPVQREDFIGACVFDPPGNNTFRLDIHSLGIEDNIGDLVTFRAAATSCTETSVPCSTKGFTLQSSENLRMRLLHIWATIEPMPNTTVPLDTFTSQTDDDPNTAGSNANPAAVAIPIVLIALVLLSVLTVLVIVLIVRRQKQAKKLHLKTRNPLAIDNQIYVAGIQESPGDQDKTEVVTVPEPQRNVYELEYTYTDPTNEVLYDSPVVGYPVHYEALNEKNKEEDIYVGENPYEAPAEREESIYDQLKTWGVRHIKTKEFKITGHLGSGQFGSVEQGVWKRQGTKPVDVALKSLTKTSEEDKVKFLQEAAIMAQFRHPNVITLHGMVTRGNPMMIMVELAKKGDLREFLLSIRPDPGELMPTSTAKMFLKFSQQVALGMQYLSAKGFVHRDLAARNVLVTSSNILKVADFGLSRDLADENYYVSHGTDKIPVKWTAPEAIHYKKYSTASDVWAYGCLLYEIWSVGHKPFEGVTNVEAIREVDSGKRLSPPAGCPKMIYQLMILSWHPKKQLRLAFRDIVLTLADSEEMVLNIPEEDSSTNPLAGVLGAPLEAGENMYSELQRRYIDFYHGPDAQTDDDYF